MKPINEQFASQCLHLTPQYCQAHKKLILACDLDETLVYELASCGRIMIRPKIGSMLRVLKSHYELCMITYSTRERAEFIVHNYLDPTGRLFGSRLLCREDIVPQYRNKLDAFMAHLPNSAALRSKQSDSTIVGNLHTPASRMTHNNSGNRRPPVWTYVVAIDDLPLAWGNLAACIPVKPFVPARQATKSQINKIESSYVASLQKFLTKLHSIVFRSHRQGQLLALQNQASNSSVSGRLPPPTTVHSFLRSKRSRVNQFHRLCRSDPSQLIDMIPLGGMVAGTAPTTPIPPTAAPQAQPSLFDATRPSHVTDDVDLVLSSSDCLPDRLLAHMMGRAKLVNSMTTTTLGTAPPTGAILDKSIFFLAEGKNPPV